ncbi:hypothetical protein LPJ61_000081 [Coemansia biformis]|uniref:Transcription factor domain-containing protein n=1 Tax=Coemansia biformis TaxID=1286918 RepID=A0A9W7YKE0_9FUNG|nr:hypothetical protein LPJ61_000081 [Coemansia biformis]
MNGQNPATGGAAPTSAATGAAFRLVESPGGSPAGGLAADENTSLSALFRAAPIDEADILPPSILQSMNFWLNDSLLTATAATGAPGYGGSGGPTQPGLSLAQLPPEMRAAQAVDSPAMAGRGALHTPEASRPPSNLVPMDFALGLPGLAGSLGAIPSSTFPSSAAGFGGAGTFAGLGVLPGGSAGRSFSLAPDILQKLGQQLDEIHASAAGGGPYVGAQVHSPISSTSPNALFGSVDASTFAHLPTSALASLNLVNTLDARSTAGTVPPLQGAIGAGMPGLFSAAAGASPGPLGIAGVPAPTAAAGVGILSESMHPVSNTMSPAMTMDMAGRPFQQTLSLGNSALGGLPGHHSVALPQGYPVFAVPSSSAAGAVNAEPYAHVGNAGAGGRAPGSSAVSSASYLGPHATAHARLATTAAAPPDQLALGLTSGAMPAAGDRSTAATAQGGAHVATSPAGLSADASEGATAARLVMALDSPVGSGGGGGNLPQMNNAIIPQMLKDAAAAHPELGSAELIYNLLITHVVHDCSRIGIYNAHLFWMRVKQYKLPRFYLFAAIADATRSWTLSDELRLALPPNLDESCYALAIKDAPTDVAHPNILTALGLYVLASYEFKSARFKPMVEHSYLSYKYIISLKFRGVPFPWRAAKGRSDVGGVDCNYQLLIRAFWRICTALHYSIEIFNLDAPDDREYLPEFPRHDDFFVQHVFVPEEGEEFGFRTVPAPYAVPDSGSGDFFAVVCELAIRQFKLANFFNKVLRGDKTAIGYMNFLREWDRQLLQWRDGLPAHFSADLDTLARQTQPLDVRRRRMNLWGLSEDEMWQKRHQWNQDVGLTMEVIYLHIMLEKARIKGYRIGLMLLLHEDLDMVRNFQNSKALTIRELPVLHCAASVSCSFEEDQALFRSFAETVDQAALHLYDLFKFSCQFGCDLHAYTTMIVSALLQLSLVYVGQVQSKDPRLAWHAMLRLAHILAMIRSLDRWGPALYSFTNIIKALGRPEMVLQLPSPETRAELAADMRRSTNAVGRALSVDSTVTSENACMDSCCQSPLAAAADGRKDGGAQPFSSKGKRKCTAEDGHHDEKRYEFSSHQHGDPHSASAHTGSPMSEDDDMVNPFPPDHVLSHIMREQKVSTSTFFAPTLPILAASLLHANTT